MKSPSCAWSVRRAWLCAGILSAVVTLSAAAEPRQVRVQSTAAPRPFDGWGTSLCWFANAVGRWPDADRTAIADALFSPQGLGLTVVRYNIGGGENPAHHHMIWIRQMEGFEPRPGEWNWNADPGQRWMLQAAIARGANRLEAFSNAPPFWMTRSQCASGGADSLADNLDPSKEAAFSEYLATVVRHFRDAWGIQFETLEPFNEPFTDYWKVNGNQEGCHFERSTQNRVVQQLRAELNRQGLKAIDVAASDETNYERALGTLQAYDTATLACLGQLNSHAYETNHRLEFAELAHRTGKRVVMSEVDGNGGAAHDHHGVVPALELAERIIGDLRELKPLRWVFWQAVEDETGQATSNKNWGLIHADLQKDTHAWQYTKKYHAMANFTKFIRPGAVYLMTGDPQTVAFYHPTTHVVVIVTRNAATEPALLHFDVSNLAATATTARVFRTSATEDLAALDPIHVDRGSFDEVLPPQSITTYVVATQ